MNLSSASAPAPILQTRPNASVGRTPYATEAAEAFADDVERTNGLSAFANDVELTNCQPPIVHAKDGPALTLDACSLVVATIVFPNWKFKNICNKKSLIIYQNYLYSWPTQEE